jgi:nucleoside-diphosphate-sugar epimerase
MSVFVTGASGFIGSHLCGKLIDQGYDVLGLANSHRTEQLEQLVGNNFGRAFGDIRDKERINDILSYYKPKTVFHLAALVPYAKGEDVIGVNATGTRNLLNSALSNGVEEFIYSSSLSVYSVPPETLPVSESHPTKPDTAYGMSKVMGELCCKAMSKSMRTIIVRYAGAFGKGMEPNRVIPQFVSKARKNRTLEIVGDGTNSSDFCHVDDLVNGTMLAWQKGETGEVYNIGSGQDTTITGLAMRIVEFTESDSTIEEQGGKVDRPFRFYLDISKAKRKLGYGPVSFNQRLKEYVGSLT